MGRILVIDDDNDTCEVIKLALEYDGYEVHCLQASGDIFQEIEETKPDLIIIDYLLRGDHNGCQICKLVKENADTKDLPVILITAYLIKFDPIAEFGVDELIAKPFDLSQIVDAVNRQLKPH